jgi:hypothetical protein
MGFGTGINILGDYWVTCCISVCIEIRRQVGMVCKFKYTVRCSFEMLWELSYLQCGVQYCNTNEHPACTVCWNRDASKLSPPILHSVNWRQPCTSAPTLPTNGHFYFDRQYIILYKYTGLYVWICKTDINKNKHNSRNLL